MLEEVVRVGRRFAEIVLFLLLFTFAHAQKSEDSFAAESLKLRTALHYDSALGAPLDALVRLYQKDKREEELIGLYQAHIAKYPEDPGAKAVLIRILTALERDEVDELVQSATQQHSDFSHLRYLLSRNLKRKDETRSLEALSRAIDLETGKNRRSQWLGELLERSNSEKGRELATGQLKKLLLIEGQTGPTMLSLGQVMQRHQFWQLSLVALVKAIPLDLNPEQRVEANVLAAKAEAALGKSAAAGQRLDSILAKLAPDHHRRNEVMSLRVSVIASDEERLTLLEKNRKAYEAAPEKESAILDYGEILVASDRIEEAIKILRQGSLDLPESSRIEERTIGLLEKQTTRKELSDYLAARLEIQPDRSDLRYRFVKANYELGNDLAAAQDFDLVLASLEPGEKSDRILDLARFLRAITKFRFATEKYESYLELEPARLDVTRELCEIYLENGLEDRVNTVLDNTRVKGAESENLLDLTQFLIEEQFFGPAEKILTAFLSGAAALPFEPGLALARVQGQLGKREDSLTLLGRLREQTDTPARYKNWLFVALLVNHNFDSVASFFDAERAKLGGADKKWTLEQIEKFLYLCEAGERRQLTERVSDVVRERLNVEGITPASKIKFRQLLVRTLERNPEKATEVEEQLKLLAKEDPDRIHEYNLRRALLYHNLQRPDLGKPVLESLRLDQVESATLLRDCYRMLIEFGDRKLAGDALAAVTSLEPGDLFSWERRLSLLAAEGNETDFRIAVRALLQGIAQRGKAAQWRADTRQALQWHLQDSYWRSIAQVIADQSNPAEALPLLQGAEREAQGQDLLWVNWARAYLFGKLGREEERISAVKQLTDRLSTNPEAMLSFPDGLSTPLRVAIAQLQSGLAETSPAAEEKNLPLLGQPQISWAFEIDEAATVLQLRAAGDSLVVLDDHGQVYRVDAKNGKLLWKKKIGISRRDAVRTLTTYDESPFASTRHTRNMLLSGNRFLLLFGRELRAYSGEDGSLKWIAELPRLGNQQADPSVAQGAPPESKMAVEQGIVVLFDPASGHLVGIDAENGKTRWENTTRTNRKGEARLVSLNSGISIQDQKVFAYGIKSGVFRLDTGEAIWRISGEDVRVFPVTLREQREDLSEEELVTLEQIKPEPIWVPLDNGGRRHHISHLQNDSDSGFDKQVMSFLNYPGTLLAPAVEWASNRLTTGKAASAWISRHHLWLLDENGAQRISLHLPLAARHFKADGTLLGVNENHAWVLNRTTLSHLHARKGEVRNMAIDYLGEDIRGSIAGNRVYVRGDSGVAVFNALSGNKISGGNWDPSMKAYLADNRNRTTPAGESSYLWQGIVRRNGAGYPSYCYPLCDLVIQGKYCTVFDGNRIVAVSD